MNRMAQQDRAMPLSLTGPRIILRRLEDVDAPAVFATTETARAHLTPWMHWPQQHRTLDETRIAIRDDRLRWLLRERFSMGIFALADASMLGNIVLNVEVAEVPSFNLSYWVRPEAEGNGYVSEATQLIVTCAFDLLGARRVGLYCDPRNTRSARVAERLGFVFEGRVRNDSVTPDGSVRDTLVYSMIPEDYARARTAWDAA
jgi:RimJ/RimL family protein N-acetyltransferase